MVYLLLEKYVMADIANRFHAGEKLFEKTFFCETLKDAQPKQYDLRFSPQLSPLISSDMQHL